MNRLIGIFCLSAISHLTVAQLPLVYRGPFGTLGVDDAVYANNDRLFISSNGTYYTDDRVTWTKLDDASNSFGHQFTRDKDGNIYAYSNRSVIRSFDSGTTWETLPLLFFQFNPVFMNATIYRIYSVGAWGDTTFVAHNDGLGYLVGNAPYGTLVSQFAHKPVRHVFVEGNTVVAWLDEGKIYASTDRGLSWTLKNEALPFTHSYVSKVLFHDGKLFFIDDALWMSSDLGATWEQAVEGLDGPGARRIDYANGAFYATTYNSGIFRFNRQSEIWEPLANTPAFAELIAGHGNRFFVSTSTLDSPVLYESTDEGDTWHQISVEGINSRKFHRLSMDADSTIYATHTGGFHAFKKEKGASYFTRVDYLPRRTSDVVPDGDLLHTVNGGHASFATYNRHTEQVVDMSTGAVPGLGKILKTPTGDFFAFSNQAGVRKRTGTDTWEYFIAGSSGPYWNDLEYANEKLYLGTSYGLYVSPTTSADWQKLYTGDVTALAVHDTTIVVNGAVSNDMGQTWIPAPYNFNDVIYSDNVFYAAGFGTVYISFDRGQTWSTETPVYKSYPMQFNKVLVTKDSVYLASETDGIFSFKKKKPQVVSFSNPGDKRVGEKVKLSAFSNVGLPVTIKSSSSYVATIDGDEITFHNTGLVDITAEQSGNLEYYSATPVTYRISVDLGIQEIAAPSSIVKTFGDSPFELPPTTSAGRPVLYTTSDYNVAQIDGTTVTILGAGSATINAKESGNHQYEPLVFPISLEVNKAPHTITFNQLNDVGEEAGSIALQATSSIGHVVSFYSEDQEIEIENFVLNPSAKILGPGLVTIVAYRLELPNYVAATVSRSFCILPRQPTITWEGDHFVSSSAVGNQWYLDGLAIEGATSQQITPTGGTYTVQVTVEGCSSPMSEALFKKQDQTISYRDQVKSFGDPPFELDATASSGLPLTYESSNESVATVSGNVVTIVGAGTATISATQSGNEFYNPQGANIHLMVHRGDQTVTFPAIDTKQEGGEPFTLTATSSSGLPVIFETSDDEITIDGNIATIVKPGYVTIGAWADSNINYNGSAWSLQSFCVNPSKPTITVSDLTLVSSSATGNVWMLDDFPIAVTEFITVTEPGSYTVKVNIEGCESETSDPALFVITAIPETTVADVIVYPNPVVDKLYVHIGKATGSGVVIELYDVMGRRQAFFEGSLIDTVIDMRAFTPGTYALTVKVDGQKFLTKRIVKAR